jgi:hypothetical protein
MPALVNPGGMHDRNVPLNRQLENVRRKWSSKLGGGEEGEGRVSGVAVPDTLDEGRPKR